MNRTILSLTLTVLSLTARAQDSTTEPKADDTDASNKAMSTLAAIERFGRVSVTDGSSYFTFAKDHTFRSGPLGMSGREFVGRWTVERGQIFTVTAKMGWANGINPPDEYRRIVFYISGVQKRPTAEKISLGGPTQLFGTYLLIEEMTKITKAEYDKPK